MLAKLCSRMVVMVGTLSLLAFLGAVSAGDVDVMAIYFGDWHSDPQMAALHGPNWTEWGLVVNARPRYPGHYQPNLPLNQPPGWGIGSAENTPEGMKVKIDAAVNNAVDVFLFDWYWYAEMGSDGKGGGFLNGALEDGYLQVPQTKLKFALMWANQDWVDVHPAKRGWASTGRSKPDAENVAPNERPRGVPAQPHNNMLLQFDGFMNSSVYSAAFEYVVDNYLTHPNYYKVQTTLRNGTTAMCGYYAMYQTSTFVAGVGGLENAANVIEKFHDFAESKGTCVHFVGMIAGGVDLNEFKALGVASSTSYCWMKLGMQGTRKFPIANYTELIPQSIDATEGISKEVAADLGIKYAPVVSVGWDSSPRTLPSDPFGDWGYPWGSSYISTPQQFKEALRQTKDFVMSTYKSSPPPILINAWNEWSEGAYLEPDQQWGFQKLAAIKSVFG